MFYRAWQLLDGGNLPSLKVFPMIAKGWVSVGKPYFRLASVSVQLRLNQPMGLNLVHCTYSLLILLVQHTYLAYIRLSIVHYYLYKIFRLFSLSLSLYILNMVSELIKCVKRQVSLFPSSLNSLKMRKKIMNEGNRGIDKPR